MENEINCHQKILCVCVCVCVSGMRRGVEANLMICEISMIFKKKYIFKLVPPETLRTHTLIKTML